VTVRIAATHYVLIAETAAAHLGVVSARYFERTGWLVQEELLASMLYESWSVERSFTQVLFDAYMTSLRNECDVRGLTMTGRLEVAHSVMRGVEVHLRRHLGVTGLVRHLQGLADATAP